MARICPWNVVFVSGMHGTGKSTLINKVVEKRPETLVYHKCEMTQFTDCFERQVRRIAKYRIDYERICAMAYDNPTSMIITDRCYYDAIMYLETFRRIGLLKESGYCELLNSLRALFPGGSSVFPKHVFMLNPGKEEIFKHIRARQEEIGAKWNETDKEYNETCFNVYNENFLDVSFNSNPVHVLTDTSLENNANEIVKFLDEFSTIVRSVDFNVALYKKL